MGEFAFQAAKPSPNERAIVIDPVPVAATPSIESIIREVASRDGAADELERLLNVYERMQDRKAVAEFNAAFAAFQGECPPPPRSKKAKIATRSGGDFGSDYADVESIMRTVQPVLRKHGLAVSFADSRIDGQCITETAIVSHVAGHSRSSAFTCTIESPAGMSPQQKYGAASTYCQRRALSKVLGIWTGDPDTDGADPQSVERISAEQENSLLDLLAQRFEKRSDEAKARLVKRFGVSKLSELTVDQFAEAVRMMPKGAEGA